MWKVVAAVAVKAVVKACRLLMNLAAAGAPQSLQALARGEQLPASTAYRLLETLCGEGLVEQLPDRSYRVGVAAFKLARAAQATRSVMAVAEPVMAGLVSEVGESVSLVLFSGTAAQYVRCLEPVRALRAAPARIGENLPLHCTATGKVLLASLPEAECRRLVAQLPLPRRTAATITDPGALLAEVARVRSQGYAVDDQEFEEDLVCVAAPLWDAADRAVGALSVSGHRTRLAGTRRHSVVGAVRRAAATVSAELGAPGADRAAPVAGS